MSSSEAAEYVWGGAIPLQIHLHESEVTTLPPPPPALILGPRIGYFPLLIPLLKPHFSSALPPGVDTVWFDYKGLPLKWYIPTGVLFDLLCVEPERPWNLTIHFRGYPSDILTPCEGEDSAKWSYINSLKEAAYIMNGNCKNVMNMSQADQLELWQSIINGQRESYLHASSTLKLGPLDEDCMIQKAPVLQSRASETNIRLSSQTGRIPVRIYLRFLREDFDDLRETPPTESWENISYINCPVDVHTEEGKHFTLRTALESLLPYFFSNGFQHNHQNSTEIASIELDRNCGTSGTISGRKTGQEESQKNQLEIDRFPKSEVRVVRIQGIEPELDIPLSWVFNNLANPDYFLHICLFAVLI